jgi:inositol oxygenase
MYHVVKNYLPEPGLYMIRYHSCYPIHQEGEYQYLMNEHDRKMFQWVKAFNPYDLYSKNPNPPRFSELKPYYEDLLAKYLPSTLRF